MGEAKRIAALLWILVLSGGVGHAQSTAKEIFGRQRDPIPLEARSIGSYTKGCLAGAKALAVNGPNWQVMRLSRHRMFGHPKLIEVVERIAKDVPSKVGWPGILVGDLAQARGGPMLTGHASHQIGLDADIWLTPMPSHQLTAEERENMSAINMVADDRRSVDPQVWTKQHVAFLKLAANQPEVSRLLVNPAIKKAVCEQVEGDRRWLQKVRPWWGHTFHVHVRLKCPKDSMECVEQDPVPPGEGCGQDLEWWFQEEILNPTPGIPAPPLTMDQLPPACRKLVIDEETPKP